MKKYEELKLKLVFYLGRDVIATSASEKDDDLGSWDDDWFTGGN